MKRYYYVRTYLTPNEWEEMIVSQDDPEQTIIPHILIWPNGGIGDVEENPMYQVLHRKYRGKWEQVHYSFTYLPDNLVISKHELIMNHSGSMYPPGFHMK